MRKYENRVATLEKELQKKVGQNISVLYIERDWYELGRDYGFSHVVRYLPMDPGTYIPEESTPFDIQELPGKADIIAVPAAEEEETKGKSFFQVMNEKLLQEAEDEDY